MTQLRHATDRAAVSTSRSFSAASFFLCLAIRSKNFRSSALLALSRTTRKVLRTRDKLHLSVSMNNYALDRHICHACNKEVVKSFL